MFSSRLRTYGLCPRELQPQDGLGLLQDKNYEKKKTFVREIKRFLFYTRHFSEKLQKKKIFSVQQ